MKKIYLIFGFLCAFAISARAQNLLKSDAVLNGFYALSMDRLLDTISAKAKIHIVYDKKLLQDIMVTDHYVNEHVKDVLDNICKANNLHYWVESSKTLYVIDKPSDLSRLKNMPFEQQSVKVTPAEPQIPVDRKQEIVPLSDTEKIPVAETKPARKNFSINGRVIDRATGESLPGAIVKLEYAAQTSITNADGYFTILQIPSDTCRLTINYVGYQQEIYPLSGLEAKTNVTIGLFQSIKLLNEVNVKGKKGDGVMNMDKRKISTLQLSPARLDELPNVGERDILRTFQLMPGVSGSNESSSGAYVRGGTPDQNLVLFDGFTVYQVDHLYGFFSAFNSNAVKDVTMYKGGFSPKFGGRLSSVTDIVGKEGNSKELNIGGDISLLSANVFAEKPINDKSTFIFAYRRSYEGPLYNKIFKKFNSTSESTTPQIGGNGQRPPGGGFGGGSGPTVTTPSSAFYDLNAKYNYAPDDKNRFSWSYYMGNDNLDNSQVITLPSFISGGGNISNTDKTTYGNIGSSVKWSRRWTPKLYSNTLVSYSSYHSDRDNSTKINITDADGTAREIGNGTFEKNRLKDLSLKSDWELQLSGKAKLLFGNFASAQDVSYEYSQNDTSKLIDQKTQALTAGLYGELELQPSDKLQIKPGLRANYYDQTGKLYYEPRLSASYLLTDRLTLKASTGKFYQFTNRVIREDILSGSRDFWVLSNGASIPVSSAKHFIAGFSYETPNFLIDIEGYYKILDNLSEYSQRQTGNRRTGIALEENFYTGSGTSKGVEFLLQKTRGKFTGWLSYTLAKATNNFEVYGGDFAANQDNRHEAKVVGMYRLGRWAFSATWIFATGKPYTAPLTSYTINNYSGTSQTFLTVSDKNAERLPSYHRLDASATYDFIKVDSRKVGSIGFSLFNVYNRTNIWYKQYSIVGNQVITSNVSYLGLTPNITLSLKLK
ncbi:TonB-dependent receptor [Pedobacter rhodius]|uniref:TonB-dependent receptor n=1 Tax=Pedobacter rhodius TaxID=3004098 RepID=A0ABT4KVZ9_9SPHI|nr:TonB-dependent receptor [Pedobacter sp. SJ11]MCZ4222931.1 TonB-dependent receptor [Pedobacter sp. SJ11]